MTTFPNKFPGACSRCGTRVPAQAGVCTKVDGKWNVTCARPCERREQVPATPAKVGDLAGIMALFARAKRHLKFPAIVLSVPALGDFPIRMHVAGDRAREPGSLTVCAAEKNNAGEREWLGRVSLDGTWTASRTVGDAEPAIAARLREFSCRPAEVAAEHGRLTGHCCFCNIRLSDARSTAVGYGPICADHFGLPWGSERHTFDGAPKAKRKPGRLVALAREVETPFDDELPFQAA